jgi:hypothetical protein
MAQPMPQMMNLPVQQPSSVRPQQLVQRQQVQQHQKFDIKVVVHNPTSSVDVEAAIVNAMRKQANGVSLSDEEL